MRDQRDAAIRDAEPFRVLDRVFADDQPLGERCEFDANQNYQCTELYGVWTITFDLGEFYWDTYQFVGSGTYTCSKGKIVGKMNGQTFEGTYGGGSLTWDGLRYRR